MALRRRRRIRSPTTSFSRIFLGVRATSLRTTSALLDFKEHRVIDKRRSKFSDVRRRLREAGASRWDHQPNSDAFLTGDAGEADGSRAADPRGALVVDDRLRIVTWNIAARRKNVRDQVAILRGCDPDIVALQEVTTAAADSLREGLASECGLHQSVFSLVGGEGARAQARSRGVLIASRLPTSGTAPPFDLPWAEKGIAMRLAAPAGPLDVFTAHVPPGSSHGWTKIEHLEAIRSAMLARSEVPRVLTGDFNCPQRELPGGEIVTWAQVVRADGSVRMRRRLRGAPALRWDEGERGVLSGLEGVGMQDAFRRVHGPDHVGVSWVLDNARGRFERRFDHALLSRELVPRVARYHDEPRREGVSDHAPLEVVFSDERAGPGPGASPHHPRTISSRSTTSDPPSVT